MGRTGGVCERVAPSGGGGVKEDGETVCSI